MKAGSALNVLIGACSAALLAPLLLPLFSGRVFVYNDLSWFHLPLRYLYQQALAAGDSVLWTPAIFSGLYVHGEGQLGAFHPFHQLLYRVAPLGAAFNLEIVANYPLAFAGTFWFLHRLQCSRPASLFGAMLFAFSGFNLLHHHHVNMVAVLAHMPWLLALADVFITEERRRRRTLAFAGLALVLGSEILVGFPQAVSWNLMTLAAFAVFRAGQTHRWRRLLPCAAAVLLGVMLGGIQLVPTADAAAQSTRTGLEREFALTYSMHPYNLFQLWSPYFFERGGYSDGSYLWFHEFGIYSGAVLPIAAIWVWIRRRSLQAQWVLAAAALAFVAVALVLALGRYGGVAVLLSYVPGMGSLRAPIRYIVLAQFALAVVAAIAFDDLRAIVDGTRVSTPGLVPAMWIPAALGVVSTIALNGRLLPYGKYTFASAAQAAPGVAIVVAVTVLIYLAARRAAWALPALIVVTAADLGAFGVGFVHREPSRTIPQLTERIVHAPRGTGDSYAAAPAYGPYKHNLLVLQGYRLSTGYAGLYPASVHGLDSDLTLRLSGTRWRFTPDGDRHDFEGGAQRFRLEDLPGLRTLPPSGPQVGPQVALIADRPGLLVAEVRTPSRATLAFTERFHTGWSATANGTALETVRVEGDFLGCVVDAGVHRVELRFMPRSFVYGALLSAIAAALVAAVVVWFR